MVGGPLKKKQGKSQNEKSKGNEKGKDWRVSEERRSEAQDTGRTSGALA